MEYIEKKKGRGKADRVDQNKIERDRKCKHMGEKKGMTGLCRMGFGGEGLVQKPHSYPITVGLA